MKTKIYYKRLLWIVFILLYSGLFFYNCLSPYPNWFFSYLYTMVLILWLCREYYEKSLFFQPRFTPPRAHNYLLRGFFAFFFYSSFVFGISTIVWWQKFRITSSPIFPLIGIFLLLFSIYLRQQSRQLKNGMERAISKFYISIFFLILSMAFGYDSSILFILTVVIGLPLILLQGVYYINYCRKDA